MDTLILGLPVAYYIAMVAKVLVAFVFVLLTVAYATYAERKIIGHMQVRLGPMRTGWHGLLQPIADGVKLFFKEEIIPSESSKFAFLIAPLVALIPAFISFAVIPFGDQVTVFGYQIPLQIAGYYDAQGQMFDINIGVLYILAMASLGVYGVVLAGWASNSKYSLLGGIRGLAQLISYELSMGLSLVPIVMLARSFSLTEIVDAQAAVPFIVYQPLAFIIFLIIVILTWGQRRLMAEDKKPGRLRRAVGHAAFVHNNSGTGPTR